MDENTTAVSEIQTVDEHGEPVKKRIVNAASAHSIFTKMVDNDAQRSKERSKIKGMIDGQRPYSEKELRDKGQAWRSNVNWREAEGLVDGNTNSYTKLVMELSEFVDVNVSRRAPFVDPEGEFGSIIAEEYSAEMKRWPRLIPTYMIMAGQLHRYGKGSYVWSDPYNWQYKAVKVGNVFLPDDANVILDDNDILMIAGKLSPTEAYRLINNDMAESMGWKIDALKAALVKMYTNPEEEKTMASLAGEWEDMQYKISTKQIGLDDPAFRKMNVVYVYEKSLTDKKVRMSIIRHDEMTDEYLFDKEDAYDNFNQVAALFVLNYGEGDYHDIRGLGKKMYAHVETSNRLMNSIVDGTFVQNSLLMTGNADGVGEIMKIKRIGPYTLMPDGLTLVQQNLNPRMDGSIAVRSMLSQSLTNNTGANKTQPETGSVARVAADVRYRASKEQDFSANERMIFYSQWNWFHLETMRRMLNPDYPATWAGKEEADRFIENCVARGVPRELLNIDYLEVTARQSLGIGSSLDQDTATKELMTMVSSMGPKEAHTALRDRCAVLVGYSNVDRYFPNRGDQMRTNDHSLAQLENNDLMEGQSCIVGSDQPHIIHATMHLEKLVMVGEQYSQLPEETDLGSLARYFIAAVEHTTEHLAIASSNPVYKDDAETLEPSLMAVAKIRDEILREVQKMADQRQAAVEDAQSQANQAEDPELRMKLEEHAVRMKILLSESSTRMALKEQMQASTIRQREIKAAHAMALKRQGQ